jgi:hypothetical protein
MIWESGPWRRELLRGTEMMTKWSAAKTSDHQMFLLEKNLFFSAFAVRKLIEARKIPDQMVSESVAAKSFVVKRIPTLFNWHRIERNFDLTAPSKIRVPIRELFNVIIHSYVLVFDCGKSGRVSGFYVASDRSKKSRLLYVSLKKYTALCRKIARSEQRGVRWELQPDGSELVRVT